MRRTSVGSEIVPIVRDGQRVWYGVRPPSRRPRSAGSRSLASASASRNGADCAALRRRVTFVRLRWTQGTLGAQTYGRGVNMWLHEFPRAEQFLMGLLRDFTTVDAKVDGSLILTLDDPALFQHPIALMQEPGFWTMTDEEAARLREYLLKGGFVIFNDFEGRQWENFEAQMRRVLPDGRWLRLDPTHRIFDSFFLVEQIDLPNPYNHHLAGLTPEFFGLFENNDPPPPDVDRQLQHQPRRVLAVGRDRILPDRADEQRLRARHQLLDVRPDALTRPAAPQRPRWRQGL